MSRQFVVLVLVLLGAAVAIQAQIIRDAPAQLTVTATTNDKGVRFVALGDVVEIRLEVFSPVGEKLFDTEFRRGNLLDWITKDSFQQPLVLTESSLCVVTARTLAGQLRQRHGLVSWQSGRPTVRRIERDQLSAAQSQAWDFSRAAQALPPLAVDSDTA